MGELPVELSTDNIAISDIIARVRTSEGQPMDLASHVDGGSRTPLALKHISYLKIRVSFSYSQSDRVSKPYICKQPVKAPLPVRIE